MRFVTPLVLLALWTGAAEAKKPAPTPPPTPDLSVRWVRTSEEYKAAVRGTYAAALDRVLYQASRLPSGVRWAVISDLDETLLDNSQYQVEVAGTGYTPETWATWEKRGEATVMPGAVDFVQRVHSAGGRFVYITNRADATSTMSLLQARGLWSEGDRLCVKGDSSNKAARRASVREGKEPCGWAGEPALVLAYLGDQVGDFPAAGEEPSDGLMPWGHRWFMLPNPMYGGWAN
jgi:acid phosphatase